LNWEIPYARDSPTPTLPHDLTTIHEYQIRRIEAGTIALALLRHQIRRWIVEAGFSYRGWSYRVRTALICSIPDLSCLRSSLQATYEASADLAKWNRASPEGRRYPR